MKDFNIHSCLEISTESLTFAGVGFCHICKVSLRFVHYKDANKY